MNLSEKAICISFGPAIITTTAVSAGEGGDSEQHHPDRVVELFSEFGSELWCSAVRWGGSKSKRPERAAAGPGRSSGR